VIHCDVLSDYQIIHEGHKTMKYTTALTVNGDLVIETKLSLEQTARVAELIKSFEDSAGATDAV
jgi:hypothetical protein